MTCRKVSLAFWVTALSLLFCLDARSANAQTVKPDGGPTIQELLTEVRLLRKTLERTNLAASRSQITLELMRRHNEQVQRLTREVESVKEQIERTESTIPNMNERAKLAETLLEHEMDAARRAEMEFSIKENKRSVEKYKVILERLREREVQVSSQLRAELAKLAELDSRLESLDREIQIEVERQRNEEAREGKKEQE